MTAISTNGTQIIAFFASIINALFGSGDGASWSSLLDYFLIGITVSLLFVGGFYAAFFL